MKQKEICKEEIILFYLWLCGTIGKEKGEDKGLCICVALLSVTRSSGCFLKNTTHSTAIVHLKRLSSLPHALLQQKECSHYKPMYWRTWNDYTQITPTQKELLP